MGERWEYMVQTPTADSTKGFVDAINDAGRDGWQLIESWETVAPDFYGPGKHKFSRAFIIGRSLPAPPVARGDESLRGEERS